MLSQLPKFQLTKRTSNDGISYQHLFISLPNNHYHLTPDCLSCLELPFLESHLGIILEGKAPLWLYSYLAYSYRDALWVGCYQLQANGGIVVNSNTPNVHIGQKIPIVISQEELKERAEEKRKDTDRVNSIIEEQKSKHLSAEQELSPTLPDLKIEFVNNVDRTVYQSLVCDTSWIDHQQLKNIKLPKTIDLNQGVIIRGSLPNWLSAYLVFLCSSAPWIGCYNVYTGVVIVHSRDNNFPVGKTFDLTKKNSCPAIIIGGDPDQGKGVLGQALDKTLKKLNYRDIHIHRANWDGEGDWLFNMNNRHQALLFSMTNGGKPEDTESFFKEQSILINQSRLNANLLLVDFGGFPKEKDAIVLDHCTHFIILYSNEESLQKWRSFFSYNPHLIPLAIIKNSPNPEIKVTQKDSILHLEMNKEQLIKTQKVPQELINAIIPLIDNS